MHIGVGARDVHVLIRQAEFFGGNLAQHRQRALTDFAFAADDGGAAIVIDAHDGRAAVPIAETTAAIDVQTATHTEAMIRALIFVLGFPVDEFHRFVDALLQLATGDLVIVRRYIARHHRIHVQQVRDIDAQLFSGEVPCLLHRPVGGRIAETAKRAGGHQVGIHQPRMRARVRIFVQRIVAHRGRTQNRLRLAGVSAVVGPHFDFFGQHLARLAEAELDPVAHGHARMAGEKFFLAGVDQLHRLAGFARQHGADHRAVVVTGFATETAADFGLNHAHLRFGNAQRHRVAPAREIRRLRVAPQRVAPVGKFRYAADGLQRGVPLALRLPRAFDDAVTRLETGIDLAAFEIEFMRDVAGAVIMHQRRVGCHRLVHRQHSGQHLVFDDDFIDRSTRDFRCDGGHSGHFIAHITHAPDRQRIQIGPERTPFFVRGIFAGNHRFHAGHRTRGRKIDRNNARIRMRTAQHRAVQHAGHLNVGHVQCRAGDFGYRVGALNVFADDQQTGGAGIRGVHDFLPARCPAAIASL